MVQEVDQASLPHYKGKFSFHSSQLQRYIGAAKPDYIKTDPKTWPVVTSLFLEVHLGYEYDGIDLLPPYVAYERELVEQCTQLWSDKNIEIHRADGEKVECSRYFHHFPFIFSFLGDMRSTQCMPAHHYEAWVYNVTGDLPETHTRGERATSVSKEIYDEILEMIRETPPESTAKEIERLQQELAAEKQRADIAQGALYDKKMAFKKELAEEKRNTQLMAQSKKTVEAELQEVLDMERTEHDKTYMRLLRANERRDTEANRANSVTAKLDNITAIYEKCHKELETAKNTLSTKAIELANEKLAAKKAKEDLKTKAKRLGATEKAAVMAKEQLNKIRDELKKAKDARVQKRGVGDNDPRSQTKRIKTEPED